MDTVVPLRNLADGCGCSVRRCQVLAGDGGAPQEAELRSESEVWAMFLNVISKYYDFSRGPDPRGGRREPDPR